MWLTLIELNRTDPEAVRDLADCKRMHRRTMLLAPDSLGEQPRATAGVLYRVELSDSGPQVLVQTHVEPDLSRIPPSYGRAASKDMAPLLGALVGGQRIAFRLDANPSKRLPRGHAQAGKVVGLAASEREGWALGKLSEAGLAVDDLTVLGLPYVRSGKMRHAAARLEGTATVSDPQPLHGAIAQGLGRGRSYGLGLLSVRLLR